ncbi:MAG: hypothetical protein U0T56_03205 [Ferruginibacter sp.]
MLANLPGGGGSGGVTWFKSATQPTNFSVLDNGGSNGVNINIGNDPFGATPGNTGIRLFELKLPLDTVLFSPNIDSEESKIAPQPAEASILTDSDIRTATPSLPGNGHSATAVLPVHKIQRIHTVTPAPIMYS